MFKINTLTVKNFMSVGNQTQAVDFDRRDLTLVLGENLDQGGDDSGARNGTGKTTIINALSYALYGQALTNIKRDNLINKTNSKNMLVTVDFELNGERYHIERGRKPNVLKFTVGEIETEEQQGENRETQTEIERLLGMSHEMFKHLVALNTYTQPFLSLSSNDQRTIIEQMLGITLLSEKADKLKELGKQTKDMITEEEYRIKAVEDANKRIEEQIDSLKKRQRLWHAKRDEDVKKLQSGIEDLAHIDIDSELANHKLLEDFYVQKKRREEAERWISSIDSDNDKQNKLIGKLDKEISLLEEHKCHACGQDIHDTTQEEILASKQEQKREAAMQVLANETQRAEHVDVLREGELGVAPQVFYDTIDDAYNHRTTVASLEKELTKRTEDEDPYAEQIEEMESQGIEQVSWDTINELARLRDHQDFLLKLLTNKDSFIRKRIIDQNLQFLNARLTYYLGRMGLPHTVRFMNDLTVEIQELGRDLDFDNLSRGERNRLILSLSWAFRDVWESLYHPINLLFIDEVVDSGMDASGVESALAVLKKMSRDRNKSVWLVSHKDELGGRVNNIMKVIKENGYTSYETDVEVV
jgi:DNA repair exonuclease SbcCD ATPase subunit